MSWTKSSDGTLALATFIFGLSMPTHAAPPSLNGHIEEMMQERGVFVDHSANGVTLSGQTPLSRQNLFLFYYGIDGQWAAGTEQMTHCVPMLPR